ncbi:MAG: DUF222 domain-containing protein, partial [Sporichthyaceae bacterium]
MSSTDDRGPGDDADARAGTRSGVALRRDRMRATVGRIASGQAEQLRLVPGLVQECAAAARLELAGTVRASGRPSVEELTHTTVVHEVTVILGIPKWEAEKLVERASQLVGVLPDTLGALEAGRIDLARAQVLEEETRFLDEACARAVEALVLHKVADRDGPWAGLSPRKWRSQVQLLVVRVDADAARRRREAVKLFRAVRAWAQGDGSGVLRVEGQDADIAVIDAVITDLAL